MSKALLAETQVHSHVVLTANLDTCSWPPNTYRPEVADHTAADLGIHLGRPEDHPVEGVGRTDPAAGTDLEVVRHTGLVKERRIDLVLEAGIDLGEARRIDPAEVHHTGPEVAAVRSPAEVGQIGHLEHCSRQVLGCSSRPSRRSCCR